MRLVSLCPSVTETVFALGRGADLVGVTEWCVHPRGAVEAIEKVGGTKSPDVERIVALAPDLVLLNEEENRREDAEALAAAGVRCHASLPQSPREVAEAVRSLGGALARAAAAEALARDIELGIERLERSRDDAPAVSYAYLIWRKPWMAAGEGTYVTGLLQVAGGRNALAERRERYPEITASELARANPRWVFLATEPLPFEEGHADELARASGLPRERFRIVDGELVSWHGARTPAGLDYASGLFSGAPPGASPSGGDGAAKAPPASPPRSGSSQ